LQTKVEFTILDNVRFIMFG